MIIEPSQKDNEFTVIDYMVSRGDDVVIGWIRTGEEENYFHFYPAEGCVMNARMLRTLGQKIGELNHDR